LARIKSKKSNVSNKNDKFVQILVKDSTRQAIKDYSNSQGLKMWAFVDMAVNEYIKRHG